MLISHDSSDYSEQDSVMMNLGFYLSVKLMFVLLLSHSCMLKLLLSDISRAPCYCSLMLSVLKGNISHEQAL